MTTPNAAQIAKVSLIRSPSVTHAFDMNQRFQFLNFTPGAGKVTVQAPANANLAPPGDYLLFLLDTNGVPSVGSFVRLSATGDADPADRADGLGAAAVAGQVTLRWTAVNRPGGIAHYNVHRSTTSGFTPCAGEPDRAADRHELHRHRRRRAGTYYYKVTAEDSAGNMSAPSNEASATVVPTGPPPGLVAAYGFDEGSGTTTADQSGNGNTGTLTTRPGRRRGKFGNALSFNGTNAFVTVADSNSLDLTTGMTLEGWVKPTRSGAASGRCRQGAARQPRLRPLRELDTNRPQSQVTVGGTPRLLTARPRSPQGAGRISPPPTTAPPSGSTSTAPRSRRSRQRHDPHLDRRR